MKGDKEMNKKHALFSGTYDKNELVGVYDTFYDALDKATELKLSCYFIKQIVE